MNKNKIWICFLALILGIELLSGCSKNASNNGKKEVTTDKISVVCTTFPQYDWVREIIGEEEEKFELTLLLDSGVDLHNYQPTAEDIAKIGSADVFIYVGGESEQWVEDALKEATNKDMKVINLLEVMGDKVKEEEVVEGMQVEEEEEEGEEEEKEYDEHVWLSLKNACTLVPAISEVLQSADSEDAEKIAENSDAYVQKLSELDKEYEQMVQSAAHKTVIFADRFPFRYLIDDYNLDYYAAFVGCSAETEASFDTITFLAGKVEKLQVSAVLVIENSEQKIAETVRQNTTGKNQEILVMNSLQSVTNDDISDGFNYLNAMQENLDVLKQALN